MNARRYIFRSVLHYRFAYLGVFAGAVLGATVLLGALFAGDSVAASLQRLAGYRTGRATHVLLAGDRFFREALAADVAGATAARVAPAVLARGTATHTGSGAAANQVQLLGVTEQFWQLAPEPAPVALAGRTSLAVNTILAHRLGVRAGDTLVLRLQKPGIIAGNAPVAGAESTLQTLRGTVAQVVDDPAFGRFSLETSQVPKPTVFLPIAVLQDALEQRGRANLVLIETKATEADLRAALRRSLQLADYGLSLRWLELAGAFELTSTRVFIDPEIAGAVTRAFPTAQPVLSYLVNEFRVGAKTTPYSIATATTSAAAPFLPENLGPRDIVLNEWLATDLGAGVGDEVRLNYFQTGAGGTLAENNAAFRVRAVVPLQGLAADRSWMPEFPGMSDVENASDWDPGLPLDLKRIREKDERYWDDHRGAPKAFLSPQAGREMWTSRWGDATALRIPVPRANETELTAKLLEALQPEMNQIVLRAFRAHAEAAAKSPVDFGGLFVGMSFFLIVAALGLVAMLFQLALLQRNREDALLGAVGVSGPTLLRWRLGEAAALLVAASVAGLVLAVLYTRAILRFLESIWADQAAGGTFVFAAAPSSIAVGAAAFLMLSLLGIWLAIRRQTRRELSIRLAAQAEEIEAPATVRRSSLPFGIAALAVAVVAVAMSGRGLPAQAAFYLAGFALLAAGVAACRWWLAGAPRPESPTGFDAAHLGRLNLRARRMRGLTVVGLIATAVFMVLSVASFRKTVGDDWLERRSGTGGFAFWVETTAAVNPARETMRTAFEIFDPQAAELGGIVPLRAGVGDNANCFNLNTTVQPQLLAVDTAKLAAREAFRVKSAATWAALARPTASGALPAFVDQTTLLWALKRKVGDVIVYTDENGAPFEVMIAGTLPDSVFQGYVLVDEQLFLQRFPSNPGYSVFLLDARSRELARLQELRKRLETATRDVGGRVELTRDVLAAFHEIENTYIAIFNVLGSLGVLLGSLGLAIVVARNLRERRGEFAVMSAIGIPRRVLARLVFAEFGRLVLWGVVIGAVASGVAVSPSLATLPALPTLALVGSLLVGIIGLNVATGWWIFWRATRELRPGMEHAAA